MCEWRQMRPDYRLPITDYKTDIVFTDFVLAQRRGVVL